MQSKTKTYCYGLHGMLLYFRRLNELDSRDAHVRARAPRNQSRFVGQFRVQ